MLRIAKVFEVSTDFLLGEVNTPDRTNFDIEELGLSVQAARNLYTGKANAEIVNRLLESPRFAEVTYMIEQYFDDTLAAGFAGQNQMLTTLSAMLRRNVKTDAAVQAARAVNRQKVPVYQADLTMIQNTFMAALREVQKEIGNDFTAAQSLTKGITQQMFSELTKGQDVQAPTITPEMISAAVTQSAAGWTVCRRKRWTSSVSADGIPPIHFRPCAGEAKCRPGVMSGCASWRRQGIRLPVTFCWKTI